MKCLILYLEFRHCVTELMSCICYRSKLALGHIFQPTVGYFLTQVFFYTRLVSRKLKLKHLHSLAVSDPPPSVHHNYLPSPTICCYTAPQVVSSIYFSFY